MRLTNEKFLSNLAFLTFFSAQDSVGFNLAAMKFIKQHLEDNEQVRFFNDLTLKHKEKSKKANRVTLVTLKSAASL